MKPVSKSSLRIAIPVEDDCGSDSVISDHFGRAPGFLLIAADGSGARYLSTGAARGESECAPIQALADNGCKAVLAREMGRGALFRCHEAGLQIFEAEGETVGDALSAYREDKLQDFPDDRICNHSHESDSHAGACCQH